MTEPEPHPPSYRCETTRTHTFEVSGFDRVFVIGSVTPRDRPLQFIHAAKYRCPTPTTLCLVERAGYDAIGLDEAAIERELAPGVVERFSNVTELSNHVNLCRARRLREMLVFSHGTPGRVALRYEDSGGCDWTATNLRELDASRFLRRANIEIHSCNAGSTDELDKPIWALELSCHLRQDVLAWTGRTSYRDVNDGVADGSGGILPSSMEHGGRLGFDFREWWAQEFREQIPELITFSPTNIYSNLSLSMTARLPESATRFAVPDGGTLAAQFSQFRGSEDYVRLWLEHGPPPGGVPNIYQAYVKPWRIVPLRPDAGCAYREIGPQNPPLIEWSGLRGGWYRLEVWKAIFGFPMTVNLTVVTSGAAGGAS